MDYKITDISDPDLFSLTKEEAQAILDHFEHEYVNANEELILNCLCFLFS